jgi:hypothetical protein
VFTRDRATHPPAPGTFRHRSPPGLPFRFLVKVRRVTKSVFIDPPARLHDARRQIMPSPAEERHCVSPTNFRFLSPAEPIEQSSPSRPERRRRRTGPGVGVHPSNPPGWSAGRSLGAPLIRDSRVTCAPRSSRGLGGWAEPISHGRQSGSRRQCASKSSVDDLLVSIRGRISWLGDRRLQFGKGPVNTCSGTSLCSGESRWAGPENRRCWSSASHFKRHAEGLGGRDRVPGWNCERPWNKLIKKKTL